MSALATFLAIAFGPVMAAWAVRAAFRANQRRLDRRPAPPAPAPRSLELLAQDLRRLDAQHRRTLVEPVMAKHQRLVALQMAYDDTLRACCDVLEVPTPERSPLEAAERLQLEAALAQRGLSW